MFWLSAGLFVAGVAAMLWGLSIEGLEAPQPTAFSSALGYGGMGLVAVALVVLVIAIARVI